MSRVGMTSCGAAESAVDDGQLSGLKRVAQGIFLMGYRVALASIDSAMVDGGV